MICFAIWMGRLGAAPAAVLAVVCLIEASPERAPQPQFGGVDRCRANAITALIQLETDRTTSPRDLSAARARVQACGPETRPARTGRDSAKAMQGLAVGGVALALLMMTAALASSQAQREERGDGHR